MLINSIIKLKNNCLAREESIMSELNLTPAEFNGLRSLEKDRDVSCSGLSKKMGLSYSRGSRVIDLLLNKGFIKLKQCSDDRRKCSIMLTAKGLHIKNNIDKALEDCEKDIKKILSEKEAQIFEKAAGKLSALLKD